MHTELKAEGITAKVLACPFNNSSYMQPWTSDAVWKPPASLLPQAYPTDLTDSAAVKATIAAVHNDLGPIDVLFWNPVSTPAPLLTATPEQLGAAYNVTVTGAVRGKPQSASAPKDSR